MQVRIEFIGRGAPLKFSKNMNDELGIFFHHNLGEMNSGGNLKAIDEGTQLLNIVLIKPNMTTINLENSVRNVSEYSSITDGFKIVF
jgi:hypothetical protein